MSELITFLSFLVGLRVGQNRSPRMVVNINLPSESRKPTYYDAYGSASTYVDAYGNENQRNPNYSDVIGF